MEKHNDSHAVLHEIETIVFLENAAFLFYIISENDEPYILCV